MPAINKNIRPNETTIPDNQQRYIDNTIGISAGNRTRINNLLVRNLVWCFSYAVWCISWYVPVLAFYSLAAMVWDATTRFLILASRGGQYDP